MLKDNLTIDGSVSYIINERNAIVASSDESLSGIYLLNYETIEDSFMSSNNFIERDILDTKVYAGFYNIKQPGWFMVTVLPSGPLIAQSNGIMVQYVLMYLGFLICALFPGPFYGAIDHKPYFFRHPSDEQSTKRHVKSDGKPRLS